MKDRVSANPGRYKIIFENETLGTKYAVLVLDDNPSTMGTPLNAATLCNGEILTSLGLSEDATPSDAFNAILNKMADTGWQSVWVNNDPTTDTSVTAKAYNDDKSNAPEYRKIGNIVYLRGVVSAKEDVTAGMDSGITVGTLPSEVRPSKNVYAVIHGSAAWTALLQVHSNGKIIIRRYSNGSAYQDIQTTSWLTFNVSFTTD